MEPKLLVPADRIAAYPDQTAAEALVHLANALAEAFQANLLALGESDAAEPVHKARVALRRFRTMVTAFEPILEDDLADTMQDRSRALFRILGAVRDADVMALRFAGTDRAEAVLNEAAHQRQKGRKHLKRKKAEAFQAWVSKRLAGRRWRQSGKKAKALREASVGVLAKSALTKAWLRCRSNGADLEAMSVRAQHDLRKDLKALRYLSEFFADLWPGDAQEMFLTHLRGLQDDLGEVTDSAVAVTLGHSDAADTSAHRARAAPAWSALLAQGPWWA